MTAKELRELTDEELKDISLRKDKRGCATSDADKAQRIRQEKSGYWTGISRRAPSYEAMLAQEKGTSCFTKRFK